LGLKISEGLNFRLGGGGVRAESRSEDFIGGTASLLAAARSF